MPMKPCTAPEGAGRGRRAVHVLTCVSVILLMAFASVAGAQRRSMVGWILADTYSRQDTRPTLYWPGNLLDGSNSTVWCVDGGPRMARGQSIHVGFKGSVEVDRVSITTGDARSASNFAESNRVTSVVINDGRYRRTVSLADQRAQQTVQLSPPVRGHHVVITLQEIEGDEDLTCMTGMVFRNKDGRNLNGPWMGRHLKYDRNRSPLIGVWAGGMPAAPEQFLTLYLDGTYRYVYRPHDPAMENIDRSGSYRVAGGRLQLQFDGRWHSISFDRVSGQDEFGDSYLRLELSGADEGLEQMEGTWHAWQR